MFKLLSLFLISISMTNANCLPTIKRDIIVVNEQDIMLCDQTMSKDLDLHTNHNFDKLVHKNKFEVSNSTNQTCQDCEFLVHLIQHQMGVANKTLEDIITLIKDVCQNLHSPSGKECMIIIDDVQQIIKWIMDGLSFKEICHKLGLCPTQKESQYLIRNSRIKV